MERRGCGPAQPFAVLLGMGQSSPSSFPQNLPFELSENRQKSGHRSTGGRGQVQRLGQPVVSLTRTLNVGPIAVEKALSATPRGRHFKSNTCTRLPPLWGLSLRDRPSNREIVLMQVGRLADKFNWGHREEWRSD